MGYGPATTLLPLLVSVILVHGNTQLQIQTNINFKNISHIVLYRDHIFLVDSERIYTLNNTLHIQSNVTTCGGNVRECVNVMKVFLLEEEGDKLITCGSGNEGICQIRNASNIPQVLGRSLEAVVSTENNKPAKAVLTPDNNFLVGVTNGVGLGSTYFAISRWDTQTVVRDKRLSPVLAALPDYLIYFKAAQRSENFTYLLTNQKKCLGDPDGYVSKIIRFCNSDMKFVNGLASLATYVDMEIECKKGGTKYNLIQDAEFVKYEEENYFFGVFASSDDPENVDGNGAICVTKVSDISGHIQTIWDQFRSCSHVYTDSQRYFPNEWKSCSNETVAVNCDPLDSFKYVLGKTPLHLTPLYIHDTPGEYLTKIKGRLVHLQHLQQNEERLALLAGTSRGKLIKLNFLGMNEDMEKYEEMNVHPGFPIIDFYETGESDNLFVGSERKFFMMSETDCSQFLNCEATMKGRNPLCVWCIYEGKATRKNKCGSSGTSPASSAWISALDQCLQMTLDPKGQLVTTQGGTVKLAVSNRASAEPSDTYRCVYKTGSGTMISEYSATGTFPDLNCATPDGQSSAVALNLMVTRGGTEVLLAATEYHYFNCSSYNSCGTCTSTYGICSWCTDTNTCIKQSSSCSAHKIDQKSQCPQLDMTDQQYIPSGIVEEVEFNTKNLDKNIGGSYQCKVGSTRVNALRREDILACNLTIRMTEEQKSKKYGINIVYKKGSKEVELEDEFSAQVIVYRCDILGKDCSQCKSVNTTRYSCSWCGDKCKYSGCTSTSTDCPRPTITMVSPSDGSYKGGTLVTIYGKDLGTRSEDVGSVHLVEENCKLKTDQFTTIDNADYSNKVPTSIVCEATELKQNAWPLYLGKAGNVNITVNGKLSTKEKAFTYKVANITSIYPVNGPEAGGTKVIISGINLGVGNKKPYIYFNDDLNRFIDCRVISIPGKNSTIQCKTAALVKSMEYIQLAMNDLGKIVSKTNLEFEVLDNPDIDAVTSRKGTLSGGTKLAGTGNYLQNAHTKQMVLNYAGEKSVSPCVSVSQKQIECKVPKATPQLRADTESINSDNKSRRKRSDCNGCTEVQLVLVLDGITREFTLQYYMDPEFNPLTENGEAVLFKSGTEKLVLRGANLNLVVKEEDIDITVGLEKCVVVKLEESMLECIPPKEPPGGSKYAQVNVTIGNYHKTLGYLDYQREIDEYLMKIGIITGSVAAVIIILIIIGVLVGVRKYRKVGKKAQQLTSELNAMEMEIKNVAKQEFFHMQSTMSGVNKSLVEQGFPYLEYQQYAFHTMFPADYMDNHPLLHEPVVSKRKVSDDTRLKLKRSMDSFEQLILNKFFLVSVITTMEEQKKFFLKEKSNLAGNLSAILFGRMEYLQEVLNVLITNLVEESTGKKNAKTLFRRCESITEKLLNDWLLLCQYPNIKSSFGSPLYLMFKAMQLTIESGPVDAETGDAYYTLTEEKLLRKLDLDGEEGGKQPKIEAKPLTLNVVVDNNKEMYECKVLDCDTISQVKRKCLTQIYVNYPASQFQVEPQDLHLEWHEGFGGSLNLQDEDNTNQKDSEWLRTNTLAHYNVKDDSNMALIDPKAMDMSQENYVNLAQINIDPDNVCNGSMDSTEPLTSFRDEDNQEPLRRWHLVKPDSENSKNQKSPIKELYLNRLFTTKQYILEYVKPLFDLLLKVDMCPPTTRYLYSVLDDLAEKNKVEPDTLHQWKSHSYLVRVWAKLIKQPQVIFDVDVPEYVDSSMEVLSQVLIESCSISHLKHTKDSPPQKLIFMNEVLLYREKLKDFYKNTQAASQPSDELRHHLNEVNRLQNQCTLFNKMSALYRFYQQLEPYIEDILEDLSTNKEASGLQLHKKFEQVIAAMEEET